MRVERHSTTQKTVKLTCRDFVHYVTTDHEASDLFPDPCYCHENRDELVELPTPCHAIVCPETGLPGIEIELCCRHADEIEVAFSEHDHMLDGFWMMRAHEAIVERLRSRPEKNAGDWYANQRAEAKWTERELAAARERGAGEKTIAALERHLEIARYVGD